MKKISDKKLKQLGGKVPRSTFGARGGPIRKKQRTAAKFQRAYGGDDRVAFVQSLPCEGCAGRGLTRSLNAHTTTGGTGRKADHLTIIPLCFTCHGLQHAIGWSALPRLATADQREAAAARTEAAWQSYVRSRQGRRSA